MREGLPRVQAMLQSGAGGGEEEVGFEEEGIELLDVALHLAEILSYSSESFFNDFLHLWRVCKDSALYSSGRGHR